MARDHLRVGEVARFISVSCLRLLCIPPYTCGFLAHFIYIVVYLSKKKIFLPLNTKDSKGKCAGIHLTRKGRTMIEMLKYHM